MNLFEEMQSHGADWDSADEARFQVVKSALDPAQFQALSILFECSTFESDGFQVVSLDRLHFASVDEAALFDRCLVDLASFGLVSIRKRTRAVALLDWPEKAPIASRVRREKAAFALGVVRRRGRPVH